MHTCMGQKFAYMQIKLVLINLLTTFELEMIDDFPEPNYSSIVVGPKGDTKIRFRRRHPQAESETGQTYTIEEVDQHNTESDCWIIVDGKVLDVTSFIEQHPGGVEAIANYAGREATDAVLKNISHPDTIEGTAEQFVIGRIAK